MLLFKMIGQRDKQMHFAGGFLAAFFVAFFAGWGWGFAVATMVGFLKEELIDRPDPKHHTVDVRDALATSLGGLAGAWVGEWIKLYYWN